MDEHIQNIVIQEKTYKVAYEDWKAKYEWLDLRYQQLKHDQESKPIKADKLADPLELPNNSPNSKEKIISSNSKLSDIDKHQPESRTQVKTILPSEPYGKEILNELKSILDQHLQIIGSVIADEKLGTIQKKNESKIDNSPNIILSTKTKPLHFQSIISKLAINSKNNQFGFFMEQGLGKTKTSLDAGVYLLKEKKIDIAFLTPNAYVLANNEANIKVALKSAAGIPFCMAKFSISCDSNPGSSFLQQLAHVVQSI